MSEVYWLPIVYKPKLLVWKTRLHNSGCYKTIDIVLYGLEYSQVIVKELPLSQGVRVVAEHPLGIYALSKPSGLKSHPNRKGVDRKSLLLLPYDLERECFQAEGNGDAWYLINRLDAPTSGLLLIASDPELAQVLKNSFASREVQKTYYALVRGRPRQKKELWQDQLSVSRRGGKLRASIGRGDSAVSEMELVQSRAKPPLLSLLKLSPKTGRTHQLRVQCVYRKMPIIGDATYGDFKLNKRLAKEMNLDRLFLHSGSIQIDFKWQGNQVRFEATDPLPRQFQLAVD